MPPFCLPLDISEQGESLPQWGQGQDQEFKDNQQNARRIQKKSGVGIFFSQKKVEMLTSFFDDFKDFISQETSDHQNWILLCGWDSTDWKDCRH